MSAFAAVCLAALTWAAPNPRAEMSAGTGVERFAVVIGENRALDEARAALTYADDDAVLSHRLLVDAGARSRLFVRLDPDTQEQFPAPSIRYVDPTRADVRRAIEETFAKIRDANSTGHSTEFFFVYSGHGDVQHGEGFVALRDGRLSRTYLYEEVLAKSPARRNHVIIDACRSYFLVFPKGAGGKRVPYEVPLTDVRKRFPNTGFVLSTSSDQDSHEWSKYRAGVFSHEVRSALRGGADADRDGTITYAELGAFVAAANQAIPSPKYRPRAVILPPEEDADPRSSVLLSWVSGQRVEIPPEAALGHMYMEDEMGNRLLDVHRASGEAISLYPPEERPLFVREASGDREYVLSQSGTVALARDELRPVQFASRGAAHLAFDKLFAQPFSSAAVTQFTVQDTTTVELDLADAPGPAATLRDVSPWVALGSGILGGALTLAAVSERNNATNASLDESNSRIQALNTGAVISYAVSGAALTTWLVLEYLVDVE